MQLQEDLSFLDEELNLTPGYACILRNVTICAKAPLTKLDDRRSSFISLQETKRRKRDNVSSLISQCAIDQRFRSDIAESSCAGLIDRCRQARGVGPRVGCVSTGQQGDGVGCAQRAVRRCSVGASRRSGIFPSHAHIDALLC